MPRLGDLWRQILRRPSESPPYEPASYWEGRAPELVETYDHPESWPEKGWMRAGVEEQVVPRLLGAAGARSVFVIGAGSGRQYAFLDPLGVSIAGIDIAPTLVGTCRRRYPGIETSVDTVVGAHLRHAPTDVVLSSAVLQHVAPDSIEAAVESVKALADRLVILRELTVFGGMSAYQWAHDYASLFEGWSLIHQETTDERGDFVRVELLAYAPPLEPSQPGG